MVTFKTSLEKAQARIAARKSPRCIDISEQAGYMLGQIFTQMATKGFYTLPTSTPEKKTDKGANDNNVTPLDKVEKKETPDEKQDKVVELLKQYRTDFDKSSEFIGDLVSKYDLYTSCHPDWTETQKAERLNLYLKALEAHKTELEYYQISNEPNKDLAVQRMAGTIIDDDEITRGIQMNNTDTQTVSQEYITALINRGQGYLDLYDTNGDDKISFEEFVALEEKDAGRELTNDEITATEEYFKMMNKDNTQETEINKIFLDVKEMASHRFAMSRLYDGEKNCPTNSANDITFMEWFGAQDHQLSSRLGNISDLLYNEISKK